MPSLTGNPLPIPVPSIKFHKINLLPRCHLDFLALSILTLNRQGSPSLEVEAGMGPFVDPFRHDFYALYR